MDKHTEFEIYLISAYLAQIIKNKFGNKVLCDCFDQANTLFDYHNNNPEDDEC